MTNENLMRLLRAVHELDVQAAPKQHRLRTPHCPPMPRLVIGFREDGKGWTPEERAHVRGCAYCQKIKAMLEKELQTEPGPAAENRALRDQLEEARWRMEVLQEEAAEAKRQAAQANVRLEEMRHAAWIQKAREDEQAAVRAALEQEQRKALAELEYAAGVRQVREARLAALEEAQRKALADLEAQQAAFLQRRADLRPEEAQSGSDKLDQILERLNRLERRLDSLEKTR
jgi:hypothetical protein